MAVKIELRGRGPGRGAVVVGRHFEAPESVAIAVERNDGRFLGVGGVWQSTPHWHPQFSAHPVPAGLLLDVGPEIVDGVIGVGGAPLRVLLRVDGVEDAGVLRIKDELIGSDGAAPTRPAHTLGEDAPATPDWAEETLLGPSPPYAGEAATSAPERSRRWPWFLFPAFLLAATVVGTAWYLGWLDSWLPSRQTEPSPAPLAAVSDPQTQPRSAAQQPPESDSVPPESRPAVAEPEPESAHEPQPTAEPLTGIALARAFLADGPTADTIYARASASGAGGDCEAALVLYNAAADADPRYAAKLARRYDPQTFSPGACIDTADAPYAIVYYGDAARAGNVAAQRRLGQLMTERERSGPTYEEGVAWLRKAASAGDEEAGRALNALGE